MTVRNDEQVFREIVSERHSCRAFLPDEVPRAEIAEVLTTAQRAPSWCNTQPWNLYVLSGEETERFRKHLLAHVDSEPRVSEPDFDKPSAYTGARLDRRRACGWALYASVGVQRGDRAASARQARENFALFGAPHLAVVTTPVELGTYGAVDCGVYVGTFLYAAQAHGLGAIAQAAIANHAPFVRDYLQIPDDQLVLCGLSFGREDTAHPANAFRTTRADLDECVQWLGGTA